MTVDAVLVWLVIPLVGGLVLAAMVLGFVTLVQLVYRLWRYWYYGELPEKVGEKMQERERARQARHAAPLTAQAYPAGRPWAAPSVADEALPGYPGPYCFVCNDTWPCSKHPMSVGTMNPAQIPGRTYAWHEAGECGEGPMGDSPHHHLTQPEA